ncbi:hypothetical protein RJ639_013812 [Escallonia herrerae]|uniref:F-box domain-containing protein n=1 Tax=Escallonia herrerae TaxID=1293975 RepID=A0AA89AN23_9ASTE|nr:hypothetical protein RJ639_013812 [Escallonia herrerae]
MGAVLSGAGVGADEGTAPSKPGLEDIPESCVALVLACLDPTEICRWACLNQAFYRASLADFVWESKLPENHQILVKKLFDFDSSSESKRDLYARLCCPTRFSGGTKILSYDKHEFSYRFAM